MPRMTIPKPLADQLREAIRKTGRSQYELAKVADVSQAVLSKFLAENSTKTLTLETAESIARAIGYDLRLTKKT